MGTDNLQNISDEVNAAIEALGPNATAEQITAVIEEHARSGVIYGSPSLGDVAAEEAASAYAEQHLPPGAAATLPVVGGRARRGSGLTCIRGVVREEPGPRGPPASTPGEST